MDEEDPVSFKNTSTMFMASFVKQTRLINDLEKADLQRYINITFSQVYSNMNTFEFKTSNIAINRPCQDHDFVNRTYAKKLLTKWNNEKFEIPLFCPDV